MWPTLLLMLACSGKLPVATVDVAGHSVKVEVAANKEDRAVGLMNRDSMPADRGMLFMYPKAKTRQFWMKNVRFPLSIAFCDDDGVIKRIAKMQPHDTTHTPSLYPTRYALEMNLGWFAKNGVKTGDKITNLPKVSPQ